MEDKEPLKKKGKVIITKPTTSSTIVFTRRSSRKKANKEGRDVIFKRPPPTFEERVKDLESRSCIKNFKALKYETRIAKEKRKIEDVLISKNG